MTQFESQAERLLSIIASGLQCHAQLITQQQLGDRSLYVGMSDIGLMRECPRAAILRKLGVKSVIQEDMRQKLRKELTLQRGHWLESGIASALKAHNFHIFPQLEIAASADMAPIKAHLDFVLADATAQPVVRVLELKSMKNLPATPSDAYQMQIHGQVSLLREYWSKPAFSLRDNAGSLISENTTFPDLCRQHFGLDLPDNPDSVDLQGWLLCVSMNDAKAFGPYFPDNDILADCLRYADELWQNMLACRENPSNQKDLPITRGFAAQCAWCAYALNCPKFAGEELPDWINPLEQLAKLKQERDILNEQIASTEEQIKASCVQAGIQGWTTAGQYRFKVALQRGRKILNKDRLVEELTPLMGQEDAVQLLTACEDEGEPFLRLYTTSVKHNRT